MTQYNTPGTGIGRTTSTDINRPYGNTLSAFFDERSDAEEAVTNLRNLGIDSSHITLTEGRPSSAPPASAEEHRGFFEMLADFFMPDEDRHTYAEGLSRGGYLVTTTDVPAGLHDQALDILDDEGAIDIDERAEGWKSEGWRGYEPDEYGSESTATYTAGTSGNSGSPGSSGSYAGDGMDRNRSTDMNASGDSEAIPVVQEQLRVGKRDVSHGHVRVHSYVVDEPVNEDVNLHSERVAIDRRPVDRPLGDGDRAFQDRTIEAEERSEEPVIDKQARVVEEVSLRKQGEDRTETISDNVRHTEVEVEDERDNKSDTDPNRRGM